MPKEEEKFALIVWEHTEEYRKFLEEAKQELEELVQLWRAKRGESSSWISSDYRINDDGEFIFQIIDNKSTLSWSCGEKV